MKTRTFPVFSGTFTLEKMRYSLKITCYWLQKMPYQEILITSFATKRFLEFPKPSLGFAS